MSRSWLTVCLLPDALNLPDYQRSQAEVQYRDQKQSSVAKVVGQVVQKLQDHSANADADHLWQDAHSRPDTHELTGLVGRWQRVGCQGPVHAGVRAIANAKEGSHDQCCILGLEKDEEQAHDCHYRT